MKKILQGMLVGLGKIIPGVSGSVIAISLGIYEDAICAINNFFKDMKGSIKYLFPIGLGIIISIIFSSRLISNMLDNYYVPTILFFLGLIVGGAKDIAKEAKKQNIFITLLSGIIFILLGFVSNGKDVVFDNYFYQFLFFTIVGFIDAATMVIPGISGTAVLMMIGCYYTLIGVVSDLTNINNIIDNLSILIPFLVGMILGIFIVVKIVNFLFKNYYHKTYNAILGFLFASIIYMFITTLKSSYTMMQILIGILLSLLGYIITKRTN